VLLAAALSSGCTPAFAPRVDAAPSALERAQVRTIGPLAVQAAVLTDAEARDHFGIDLGLLGVQATWLSVRNDSPATYWLVRNTLDPDLYSADEVAHLARAQVPTGDHDRLRQFLRDESMRVRLAPRTATRGFVFLPRAEGGRYLDVTLVADAWPEGAPVPANLAPPQVRLGFAIVLPDGAFDYERMDPETIHAGREPTDLDENALRAEVEALPCCTTNEAGDREGDPLNLVLVGSVDEVLNALERSGWSFTHRITLRTIRREVAAAISGEAYPVAPVSALYALGRRHDVALQRARQSIAQRVHLRLWLAPFRAGGRDVWLGQVSRDIGVKVTAKSSTLTTHVIDPEVDATREYLLHSLLAEGLVERFGFARGSRAATPAEPASNLTGDPYFSDGMRLVVFVAHDPLPLDRVRNLRWERSAPPIASGQGEGAARNVQALD
jgi:hypothetical protein